MACLIILETTHGSHIWSVPSQFLIFWSPAYKTGPCSYICRIKLLHKCVVNGKISRYDWLILSTCASPVQCSDAILTNLVQASMGLIWHNSQHNPALNNAFKPSQKQCDRLVALILANMLFLQIIHQAQLNYSYNKLFLYYI